MGWELTGSYHYSLLLGDGTRFKKAQGWSVHGHMYKHANATNICNSFTIKNLVLKIVK